jgi:Skp family chaperone for outer membrane proteins
VQATAATEAFYVNGWTDLEEFARGLEQTGRHIAKATDVPKRHVEKLKDEAAALETDARRLQEAAKARDAKKTNETMQRINLLVRELRAEE